MHEQSAADANNYAAAARQRLAQAGSDRLRDIFEDTLPDLRRQLMVDVVELCCHRCLLSPETVSLPRRCVDGGGREGRDDADSSSSSEYSTGVGAAG